MHHTEKLKIGKLQELTISGAEPGFILQETTAALVNLPQVVSSAVIHLPIEGDPAVLGATELRAALPIETFDTHLSHLELYQSNAIAREITVEGTDYLLYPFLLSSGGTGILVVILQDDAEVPELALVKPLWLLTATALDRLVTEERLKSLRARLDSLDTLNRLVVSNSRLPRIVQSIEREAAYRFSADVALILLPDDAQPGFSMLAGYGVSPNNRVNFLPTTERDFLSQAVRSGGITAVRDIEKRDGNHFAFLKKLRVDSASICCLEIRGDFLALLVLGHRGTRPPGHQQAEGYNEFSYAAGVALANALSKDELAASLQQLELANRTLQESSARAEANSRSKSRFLAQLSHQMRTPLNGIICLSDLVLTSELQNPQVKEDVDTIRSCAVHLTGLVTDVLNYSEAEAGQLALFEDQFTLEEVIEGTCSMLSREASLREVNLLYHVERDNVPQEFFGDRQRLQQVLYNLTSNALKLTERGGTVLIDVEAARSGADEASTAIRVMDNGKGLSCSEREVVSKNFVPIKQFGDDIQAAKGLRLSVSRLLIDQMGGELNVGTVPNTGSTFQITLALRTARRSATNKALGNQLPSPERLPQNLRVLVADDDKVNQRALKRFLEKLGYATVTAQSGVEVVERMKDDSFDLILLDLHMPEMDGLATLRTIRAQTDGTQHLPVVIISADVVQDTRRQCLRAGANAFVEKPVSVQRLCEIVVGCFGPQ